MKILIDDGMQIKVGTGIGKYSQYLYEGLKNTLSNDEVELVTFSSGKGKRKMSSRIQYLMYINSQEYRTKCKSADIIHFTNYAIPFFRKKGVKYAVTIHDLVAFLHPKTLPFIYGVYSRLSIKYALKHADLVFTVSESVKKEIIQRFKHYKRKVKTAYPGLYDEYSTDSSVNEDEVLKKYSVQKRKYFIFVGTIEKRKNIGILIEAFTKLKANDVDGFKLVLAGRPGKGYDEYSYMIKQNAEASENIICTGYIPSNECNVLYKNAAAYVFPSIYEGFGSTQLECMVHHLPLICSDIPTNREISGDYGLFFDLNDTESLVKQMKKIVDGEYDYEAKAKVADAVVERFKWDNVVHEFIEAYEDIVNEQR